MKRHFNLCLLIIFILAPALTFFSCKKAPVNEVKINDFASLSAEFKSPPAEYTTAPFFVWNYKITNEEIDRYLEDFKAQGSRQVFVHPRPGLVTEYLSGEWFSLFKHAVDKGKELGMKVWIYDENSYPSGFAGGHVPDQMPESYNQGQGLIMTRFETLPDTAEKYYLCLKEDNGSYKDITKTLEAEKGKQGSYLLFSKTYNGKSDWYGGFSYVDLLYPGVTQKFIELTMTGYEKCAGPDFGQTVPGVFTDEPQINSSGGIRWTPDLFDVFQQKWHYDLKTNLPSLFEETGDWKRIRHNYTQTLLQLFIDRWAKPYYEYCEAKGLKFTGHYWEHEWPNMRPGGDNMAMYAWHQQPSIDMLFNQFDDSTARAQFGNVRAVKELASAANQTGRQRKLSETYGGSGWDLTFRDMKRNGDWEYALGVNLMNQHLTYFTMAGARKYDYPPTFDYHEPWWNDYKYINDHYARLSLALSSGLQVNDILVIEPTTSAWLYDSYTKRNPRSQETGQAFQTFVTTLEKNQVEYDLGSENIIMNIGSVKGGKFVVGQRSYSRVVLPPMMENLDLSTYKLLERFVANGGTFVAFSVPALVDGAESEGLKQMFVKYQGKIKIADKLTDELISSDLQNQDLAFENVSGGTLYHHRRMMGDGQVIFLVNSDLTSDLKGKLTTAGNGAIEMNTLSGEISGYPNMVSEEKVNCEFDLPPAGSLLLFIPVEKPGAMGPASKKPELKPVETSSPLTVAKDAVNALAIDFCDITVGGETVKDLHTFNAADMVYKYHGFRNGNPWNTSVQFRRNIVDRDTFGLKTGFKAVYHFQVKDNFDFSSFRAVVERPDLWEVAVNGKVVSPEEGMWWIDRNFRVFMIGPLVNKGDNTITLTTSPMKIHAEVEPVYITGEFSVQPADKGFVIGAPVKSLTTGSWKDQGFPFYSWGVSYTREYNIEKPEGQYFISLKDWKGTVAEVRVNDKPAAVVAFPPYQAEVTGMISPGKNRIEVKVIGSLKNLMGPHHNNPAPGLSGPWLWRNVKNYPSGREYQQLDYGLFTEFELLNGI